MEMAAAFRNGARAMYEPDAAGNMNLRREYPDILARVRRLRPRGPTYFRRLRDYVHRRATALANRHGQRLPPRVLHVGWPVGRGGGARRRARRPAWPGLMAFLNDHFNVRLDTDQGVDSVSPAFELATWVAGVGRDAWVTQWANRHRARYWTGGYDAAAAAPAAASASAARLRGGEYHPTLRLSFKEIRDSYPNSALFYAAIEDLIRARLRLQMIAYISRTVHRYVNWNMQRRANVNWNMPKFIHLSQRPYWAHARIDQGIQFAGVVLDLIEDHLENLDERIP